jgi:hypothetical protein
MTPRQTTLYFREWNPLYRMLRAQGLSSAECDARRHELHVAALGYQRSSKDFTNPELDCVLAEMRRHTRPGDLDAQLAPERQARKRAEHAMQAMCRRLGEPWPAYAEGIVRRMNREGRLGASRLADLDPAGRRAVLAALTRQRGRAASPTVPASPDPDLDPVEADPF